MGTKVERVFFILIIFASAFAYILVNKKYTNKSKAIGTQKTIELNNFIEYDINATKLLSTLKSQQAYQLNQIWFLKEPIVSTDEIKYLKSKRALSKRGIVEFIDDVRIVRRDGKKYFSNKTFYKIDAKEVVTPDKFKMLKEFEKIEGVSMVYDTQKEITKAKNVKAVFKMNKKEKK